MSKYLDSTGLTYLWGKILDQDAAVRTETNTALAGKGSHITYDSTNRQIKLWAKAGDENLGGDPLSSIPVGDFIKDGMLDDVEIVTAGSTDNPAIDYDGKGTGEDGAYIAGEKFIKFTWNTDAGAEKVDYLKVDEIGKVYGAGTGIHIDESTNKISVSEVKTDITKTSDEIEIIGGPLETALKSAFPGGKIPAGTTMQDVLLKLACTEKWPSKPTKADGSAKCTIAAPSFTLGNSGTTVVEVGTACALSDVTLPSAAVPGIKSYPTVSGFTYGYSAADDNSRDSENTSITATVKEGAKLNSETYKLSIDYTLFNGAVDATNVSTNANHSNVKFDGRTLIATEGINKIKASVSGPSATVVFNGIDSFYACSNLKNTHKEDNSTIKSDAVAEQTKTSGTCSNSAELSVPALYKYFSGYTETRDINAIDSDVVRAVTGIGSGSKWIDIDENKKDKKTVTITSSVTTDAGKAVIFAVPAKYKVVIPESLSGKDLVGDTFATKTVSVKCGELNESYTVYFANFTGSGNASLKNVVISKK